MIRLLLVSAMTLALAACVSGDASPQPHAKTMYSCPMHPEVQRDHPGSCPKCNMTLQPHEPK